MKHYYNSSFVSKKDMFEIPVRIKGFDEFNILSATGIFSKDHLDNASKLLIESVDCEGLKVLDLGCGNGVVGICASKLKGASEVTFVDISEAARSVTSQNVRREGLDAMVLASQEFELSEVKGFDAILCNPPFAAGKKVIFSMVDLCRDRLAVNGSCYFVARHKKGGKSLELYMKKVFGESALSVLAKGSGFRVYAAKKVDLLS